MLEELARDVTGWPAHAGRVFRAAGLDAMAAQSPAPAFAAHARYPLASSAWTGSTAPFDEIAHTVDVRPISQDEGWYNIRNIGFHLWRLSAYALDRTRGAAARRGRRLPLSSSARSAIPRRCSAAPGARATKPGSRPNCMCRSRSGRRGFFAGIADFYGSVPNVSSITVFVDGVEIPVGAGHLPQSLDLVAAANGQDRHRRGARPPDARPRSASGEPRRSHLSLWLSRPILAAVPIAGALG